MKTKHLSLGILAVLLVIPVLGAFAQQAPLFLSIELVTTFDYPGTGNSTVPEGINDRGDITGFYTDSNGVIRGFVRFHSGDFSAPIVEPNSNGLLTEGRGINHARAVGGFYAGSDGLFHGYFLKGSTFTGFDAARANNTYVEGLNDAGDFVGAFDTSRQALTAYSNIAGVTTTINIPGATQSYAFGINFSRESTGQYTDSAGVVHGWWQDSNGAITTFDPPGSLQTLPFGLNNQTFIVGRFTDGTTLGERGFLFNSRKGTYTTFDGPGAVFTSLNGINANGMICGRYDDGSGLLHGILARVVPGPASPAQATSPRSGQPGNPANTINKQD